MQCPNASKNDAPDIVLQNYSLAFEDTFQGPTLDYAKWNTYLPWGQPVVINNEEQVYIDTENGSHLSGTYAGIDPFTFGPNGLTITAEPLPAAIQAATGRTYSSGVITTRDSLCFTGGYVECCLRLPCGIGGTWPAAWLLNCLYYDNAFDKNQAENGGVGNDKFNPEIDWEWPNGTSEADICGKNALHYFTGDRDAQHSLWTLDKYNFKEVNQVTGNVDSQFNVYQDCDGVNQFQLPEECTQDFCTQFNTVGIHWECGDFIHFYMNGEIVNCINGSDNIIPDQSMYFIANLAVGGSFPFPNGELANQADYPATLDLEYVRIYTK